MILSLFVLLLILALLLIGLGYAVNESAYSIVGFVFIFVLSASALIPNTLEYKTGDAVQVNYTYSGGVPVSSQASIDSVYDSYPNTRWFGIWVAILSGMGITISIVELKKSRRESR